MKFFTWLALGRLMDEPPAPGGGGGGNPPPNPPAYVTRQDLDTFRDGILASIRQIIQPAAPQPPAPPVPPPVPPPAPQPPTPPAPPLDPATNAELIRLRASVEANATALAEEKRLREEAVANGKKATLSAAIAHAVSPFRFQNPRGAELFTNLITSAAQLQDDGSVIANNLPLDAYVEQEIQNFAGLLQAPASGGAGLPPSGNARVIGYDMDNITPQKMLDPAEAAKALAEIRKVGKAAGYFR